MKRTFSELYKVTLWYNPIGDSKGYLIEVNPYDHKAPRELIDEKRVTKDKIWSTIEKMCEENHLPLNIITIHLSDFENETFSNNRTFSTDKKIVVELDT